MAITQSIHGPRPKFLVPSSSTPPRLSETALTFGHTMSLGGAMGCLRKGVILLWMRFHVKHSGQKTPRLGFRRGIRCRIEPPVGALFAQSHGFFFSVPPNLTIFTSFANLMSDHKSWEDISAPYDHCGISLPLTKSISIDILTIVRCRGHWWLVQRVHITCRRFCGAPADPFLIFTLPTIRPHPPLNNIAIMI